MLIPAQWADTNGQQISRYLGDDGWEMSEAWQQHGTIEACTHVIDRYMTRSGSFSGGTIYWGNDKTNDIHLNHEDGVVQDIVARFDMRGDIEPMITTTVAISLKLNCTMLIMETATLLAPDAKDLRRCAESSRAAKGYEVLTKE